MYFFKWNIYLKISAPPTTSWLNNYNILFPRDKDGKVGVKDGIHQVNNQQKSNV